MDAKTKAVLLRKKVLQYLGEKCAMSPTHLPMAQKNKRVSTGGGQKILRYYNGYKQVHSLSIVLNFHGVND